jgi:hypothetical protein
VPIKGPLLAPPPDPPEPPLTPPGTLPPEPPPIEVNDENTELEPFVAREGVPVP